jgi:formate dehydrogenase iron-sulfur subunit
MSKALLYDATQCIGCKACEQACAEQNKLPYDESHAALDHMTCEKLTVVQTSGDKFMRRLCMNCDDPTCVSVCLVAAFKKTPEGPVIYDESKCIGCRYCMLACPFQVPTYQWNSRTPIVKKCNMCADRVLAGNPTACAEICPTGATKFGDREELLHEARQRIHDHPNDYLNHVFGEHEVGGTSVLMLSSLPFATFGYRSDYATEPMPLLTWRVMRLLPDVVSVGSVLLGGIWWITHRRDAVAAAEALEQAQKVKERL